MMTFQHPAHTAIPAAVPSRAERIQAGHAAMQAWTLKTIGNMSERMGMVVVTNIGRVRMVTRGHSGPGTPYHHDRIRAIARIKAAVHEGRDTEREDTTARYEAGRRRVRTGEYDAFGAAVFGHLGSGRTR